ncbi:MAG: peptidylprolyl isomerase [Fidelibacterota bacterium]
MSKNLLIISLLILMVTCGRKDKQGNYIARVNDSYLTKDDITNILEAKKVNLKLDRATIQSIITKWVKDEILFQKAKKEHFDKDKTLQKKVDDYLRSLVIDEYLKYHFQSNVTINNNEIEEFYKTNKEIYKLDNDALKIRHVYVKDYNDANTLKSILQSSYDMEEKKKLYEEYDFETRLIKKGEVVKDIHAELFEKSTSKVVGPISTNYGFHIIEILDSYKKGDYLPLSLLRDEIYEKLTQQKNKTEYIMFTDSIFSIADYEIKEEKLEGLLRKR